MRFRDRHQGVAVHRFDSDVGDLAIVENGHTDLGSRVACAPDLSVHALFGVQIPRRSAC